MKSLSWHEAVYKRPAMYLGKVNQKGFANTLKTLITYVSYTSEAKCIELTFEEDNKGSILFKNMTAPIRKDIGVMNLDNRIDSIALATLNALSETMQIKFTTATQLTQHFRKGFSEEKIASERIHCTALSISFVLDKTIWGSNFKWNANYLSYELREFCYLNPTIHFAITEKLDDTTNTNSYHFKNGLSDRLEIEILNGLGTCYFKHHIVEKINDFELDVSFAFRLYSVDQGFIRTFVNNEITPEHGSHLEGVLNGLTYGVMQYFQANELVHAYRISEKGIREGLLCMINIKLDAPIFSGCVKNKLANPEIIEPIAELLSNTLYRSIQKDDAATQKLIEKFEIN
ncbi:MAG: hypothetical protein P1U56_05755 [Saprospiraceae bacterium]|nr:hypothetical protein [Saprospiraceae bacterium]